MKLVHIIVLMLITITDVAAHDTLAIAHSHVLPNALHHPAALLTLALVAITAASLYAIVSFYRRLSVRTD